MSDQLYLGWQYATLRPDPGPPPRRPLPPPRYGSPGDWLAAQRHEERSLGRPRRITAGAALGAGLVLAVGAAAGLVTVLIAGPAIAAFLVLAGRNAQSVWRGERELRERAAAEALRVERFQAEAERRQHQDRAEHARLVSQWQEQHSAFTRQKRWYAVPVPDGIDRVDVAGGTLAGWSAVLTMAAAYRLATGGEATVVDLSGGAVAADLARLATRAGLSPAVWVLPDDLPRLDLAAQLSGGELADVLALTAAVTEEKSSARDLAVDTAILDRVIGVLEPAPGSVQVRRVTAALRALAQVGDLRADLSAGLLTEREARALGTLYGQRATDRVVLERALGLEAQLRPLAAVGTSPTPLPRGQLRVLAVGRQASPQAAAAIGSFAVTALTHLIGRAPAEVQYGPVSWRHTLFVLGAERLRDDVLDRLTDACEASRSGLVIAYRSLPPHVRQRIGRGNAAVVYMRLGNAEDAKAASEQIGQAHRFVLSQLTETVGTSVTDTLGGSYTSTVGDSYSLATSSSDSENRSAGTGRTTPSGGGVLPLRGGSSRSTNDGTSWGTSTSTSLTDGISTSTAWGLSTSRAAGDNESLARSLQRSRELVVEPAELQRLPVTAMLLTHGNAETRQVLLADANPAIGSLPVATFDQLPPRPGFDFVNQTAPPRQPDRLATDG